MSYTQGLIPSTYRILILNYGSQYADLILRRCRECFVYSVMLPSNIPISTIEEIDPVGIILSGGPGSVYSEGGIKLSEDFWKYCELKNIPILGICYGMQNMHHHYQGVVGPAVIGEFGPVSLELNKDGINDPLFADVPHISSVWMSHFDEILKLAPNFKNLAVTKDCIYGAAVNYEKNMWCVQFHPEVIHSQFGREMFSNFFHRICKIPTNFWPIEKVCANEIEILKEKIGSKHVFAAISGGVDSLVAAKLVSAAIQRPFHGILVDTGLLRLNEAKKVKTIIQRDIPELNLSVIDASDQFFTGLKGITDPEEKRKIIGRIFINVFIQAINKLREETHIDQNNALLMQGTISSDVIESAISNQDAVTQKRKIKSHHNVGGLPDNMPIGLLEPLRNIFKDEVKAFGLELGLDPQFLLRHPFPGPGLAIRIVGEVTVERVETLRKADAIFNEELHKSGEYNNVFQAFVVLLPDCRTVGVIGDERSYGMTICLRAIHSVDCMTAAWHYLPQEVLEVTSKRITNEVKDINRVCFDITSKPPGTIEWE